jgi:hypothetical protein
MKINSNAFRASVEKKVKLKLPGPSDSRLSRRNGILFHCENVLLPKTCNTAKDRIRQPPIGWRIWPIILASRRGFQQRNYSPVRVRRGSESAPHLTERRACLRQREAEELHIGTRRFRQGCISPSRSLGFAAPIIVSCWLEQQSRTLGWYR